MFAVSPETLLVGGFSYSLIVFLNTMTVHISVLVKVVLVCWERWFSFMSIINSDWRSMCFEGREC